MNLKPVFKCVALLVLVVCLGSLLGGCCATGGSGCAGSPFCYPGSPCASDRSPCGCGEYYCSPFYVNCHVCPYDPAYAE